MRFLRAAGPYVLLLVGCGSRTGLFVGAGAPTDVGAGDSSGGAGPTGGTGSSMGTGGHPTVGGGGVPTGGGSGGDEPSSGGQPAGGTPGSGGQPAGGSGGDGGSGGGSAAVWVSRVEAGGVHSCALLSSGAVRCWGNGLYGNLGYGNTETIGDDETPASAGDVPLGGVAVDLALGSTQACALLNTNAVRCWGDGLSAGYPGIVTVGDDETPADVGDVDLGEPVSALAAGARHTCAVVTNNQVRCWGMAVDGQLGYANTETIGDNETPAFAGDVPVGGVVLEITAGNSHTCVRLDTGAVRCWGYGSDGALGYANTDSIGDDETPASAGDVDLGGLATQVAAGNWHTCALLQTGAVRCWGYGGTGALGYGNLNNIGDDETPASAGDVDVGGQVLELIGGKPYMCARLVTGAVRCWGDGSRGRLGYGNIDTIGDDETPASAGDVPVGEAVLQADACLHTCALLASGAVKCWGPNSDYQLGGGVSYLDIGDDETPASAPPLQILDP